MQYFFLFKCISNWQNSIEPQGQWKTKDIRCDQEQQKNDPFRVNPSLLSFAVYSTISLRCNATDRYEKHPLRSCIWNSKMSMPLAWGETSQSFDLSSLARPIAFRKKSAEQMYSISFQPPVSPKVPRTVADLAQQNQLGDYWHPSINIVDYPRWHGQVCNRSAVFVQDYSAAYFAEACCYCSTVGHQTLDDWVWRESWLKWHLVDLRNCRPKTDDHS